MPNGGCFLCPRELMLELMRMPPLRVKLWLWVFSEANWKSHDKLKRGQLLTSIKEMREAMSHHVGYRRETPTIDQIRSSYEGLAKAGLITTAKTTRGMIVTVLNYDLYQDFKNYEALTEAHGEDRTKPEGAPDYKGTKGNEGKRDTDDSSESPSPRPKACSLEQWEKYLVYSQSFLEGQHETWGQLVTVSDSRITAGAKALDNLIRVQGFNPRTVYETIEWARHDDFWQCQLRSLGSLTKKGRNGETKFTNILAQRAKEESDAQRHAQ